DVAIEPLLKWESGNRAAALFGRPPVAAPGRVRLLFVRRPVDDIDLAAIGLPSRNYSVGEVFVGIRNAPIVLFFVFIFDGARSGVAALPELLDEMLALLACSQELECRAL